MVHLLKPLNNNKPISPTHIPKLLYNTPFSTITTQNENENDQVVQVLYNMISPAAITPNTSLVPILDQWLHQQQQGGNNNVKVVTNNKKVVDMIKLLRNRNRYSHALQLSEWMTNKSYLDQSSGNIAVHLDLISRVRGLEHAEKFFDAMPDLLKNFKVYGTLLNCYSFKKSLEKAEATMEKMKQLRFMTTHSYHSMLTLYNKTRNYDKLLKLLHEMDKEGIRYHRTTYYMQLTAYASFDIKAMEKLLGHIEFNSKVPLDWHAYIIAAKGYLNFGKNTKALVMLRKSEELLKLIHQNTNGVAYEILLSMYANLKKRMKSIAYGICIRKHGGK
ncbi:Pentatricopeptide repeat-containing protein [Artemisia annua]|uniref:Pentatricopeptide repeat-containing protein n=1 Tax=Artemisia annua TaxID=35608 RepID=A0A2U1KRC2_ARTAN|nr:Pentatricopeptide repeat-containing protein [Artemisia annua]